MDAKSTITPDIDKWLLEKEHNKSPLPTEPELSLIIPAYNEERRLPFTLIEMVDYLNSHSYNYEIIVVDDGSCDQTAAVTKKFQSVCPQLKLIVLERNCGKGCAVKSGIMQARGRRILFADADGATPIAEITRLEAALNAGADMAIGSRALPSQETRVVTSWHRKYLGRAFNICVNWLLLPKIADTQCGFKMFPARVAEFLFSRQQANRFSFDVEILFIARRAGLKIAEVPINWTNVPGSKVKLIQDACLMFRDTLLFRWRHRDVTPETWQAFCLEPAATPPPATSTKQR